MADEPITKNIDDVYELAAWVGRRQAFASLAGSCSAADAECLRQVRDRKQYRALNMTWEEFCEKRAGISRKCAERAIRRLEEFGPQYFTLAQVTGVTPQEFRRIAASVGPEGLRHAGGVIAINSENAAKLIEAVKDLRSQPGSEEAESPRDAQAAALEKGGRLLDAAVSELEKVCASKLTQAQRDWLTRTLASQLTRLTGIQLTIPGAARWVA